MAMPNYDEFEQRDEFADRGEPDPRRIQAARQRVSAPGMLLIVFGLIGLLVELGCLSLSVTQPTIFYDQTKQYLESQPPSPDRDRMLKDFERDKDQMRLDKPLNVASCVFGALLNVLMVFGGARMRALKGYGLSMTGAICGLIPLSGCICCAMPIGLWAIIVLCNSEVKAGFAAVARGER
jgi:hypothetical protein